MSKRVILLSLFLIVIHLSLNADNVFEFSFSGKSYEQLQLKLLLGTSSPLYIEGRKENVNTWAFHIPDSVYERHINMALVVPADSSKVHQLIFHYTLNKDTIHTMQFSVGRKRCKLNVSYVKTEIKEKVPYLNNRDAIYDHYFVKYCDPEFESSLIKLHDLFGFFMKPYTYEENLEKYISLIKKYPDSHSCIAALYTSMNKYKSKADIASVFSCFTPVVRKSYYGHLIQDYLCNTKFPNYELPVFDTGEMEYIISDTHKRNLVVFTASWCKPCHDLIPVLKNIYKDLKKELVITYISIDDSKTIDQWAGVIHKYKIPWRCLKATNRLNEIMQSYIIQGIPLAYLVQPDGTFEKLNLQQLEDRSIFYKDKISH